MQTAQYTIYTLHKSVQSFSNKNIQAKQALSLGLFIHQNSVHLYNYISTKTHTYTQSVCAYVPLKDDHDMVVFLELYSSIQAHDLCAL